MHKLIFSIYILIYNFTESYTCIAFTIRGLLFVFLDFDAVFAEFLSFWDEPQQSAPRAFSLNGQERDGHEQRWQPNPQTHGELTLHPVRQRSPEENATSE